MRISTAQNKRPRYSKIIMASKVVVDTTDIDTPDPSQNVEVVPEGNRLVTIDTLRDDMDEIIKEPVRKPERRKPPSPVRKPERRKPLSPQPSPERRKPPSPIRSPPQTAPKPKKMLDGQSAFQDALKETIPGTTDPVVEEPEPEPETTTELPTGISDEAEEEEEEEVNTPEEADDEEEKVEEPEEEEEDEDVVKLRLIDEINSMMADGFLPPQNPSFSMDIKTLTKIKEYQEAAASEAFGIQLIGWGWINLIGIVENINEKFDPAARIFGPGKGLKLHGAAEKVSKNIRRYRTSFKYLWKKMSNRKLEEYSPLITMALVTLDILKNVHVENVRKEMRESAAAELNRPGAYADAIKMSRRSPVQQQQQQPPPDEIPSYSTHLSQPDEQQPIMRPVDDIDIPESDTEAPAAAAAAAPDDDDEIEVEVPKGGRKGGRRSKA